MTYFLDCISLVIFLNNYTSQIVRLCLIMQIRHSGFQFLLLLVHSNAAIKVVLCILYMNIAYLYNQTGWQDRPRLIEEHFMAYSANMGYCMYNPLLLTSHAVCKGSTASVGPPDR